MSANVELVIVGVAALSTIVALLAALAGALFGLRVGFNRAYVGMRGLESVKITLLEWLGALDFRGQTFQDKWIALVVFPGVTDGYFVDVGAWGGETMSNTKHLETLGWRGVCIDPFPLEMERRRCEIFREVVSSRNGEVVQFRRAASYGDIQKYIDRHDGSIAGAEAVELTTHTLDSILECANAPSYIH